MGRYSLLTIALVGLLVLSLSCDKMGQPSIIITDLDTTLFPGNFIDYKEPIFEENTNVKRNALIEYYTGHQCVFCPSSAVVGKALEKNNPGRVFMTSIHASPSPGGSSESQYVSKTGKKYTRDFTTPEGKEIAEHLSVVLGGIAANPTGNVNRVLNNTGEILYSANLWSDVVDQVLASPLQVNIQAKSNYYPSTNGIFIHAEAEFLADMNGEYAMVIYAIQDEIIDWQKDGAEEHEDYKHHHVHIGNVFKGESFGRVLNNGELKAGEKFQQNFSYKIPDGLDGDTMHFLIYVYDKTTEEVLQVIKHRF